MLYYNIRSTQNGPSVSKIIDAEPKNPVLTNPTEDISVEAMLRTPQEPAAAAQSEKETHEHDEGKASLGSAFVYTLNHTLACTYYDIPGPFIAAGISTGWDILRGKHSEHSGPWWKRAKTHDHGHGHHHDHEHHHGQGHKSLSGAFWDSTKHWVVGEMAGDFGAIVPTVALQHYAPGAMKGLRKVLEPVMGPLFRKSAERAAGQQASAFGLEVDSEAVRTRANELYEHEMSHLPLAFVWTPISAAINLIVQKKFLHDSHSWGELLATKAMTAALATGTVFGVRSLFPTQIQNFETGVNQHVVSPVMQTVGQWVGMDGSGIKKALEDKETPKAWAERIRSKQPLRESEEVPLRR